MAAVTSEQISSDPLVTIAIPTFNRAAMLKCCIAAALAQSYPHFEVVVSDNASTDETPEVLKACDDQRLRFIRQQTNIGLVTNWNACLAQAKGDYIVFVSDDDIVAPWLLDRCIDVARSEPGVPIVIALSDISYSSGYTLKGVANRRLGTGIWGGTEILKEVLNGLIFAPMCTILLRTDVVRARGGFPVEWGPHTVDKAVWVPLLLTGQAGLVNECCGTQATHDGTVTSNLDTDVILRDVWKVVELIEDVADRKIDDLRKRRDLKRHARRYFTLCVIYLISSRRKAGITLLEALFGFWRWRRELAAVRPSDLFGLSRSFANILLPRAIVRLLGSINRASWSMLNGRTVA
ncbi:glycosyltransferase involved in cell wall biosynthesis [Bradyrhizobium sp. LM2.7]